MKKHILLVTLTTIIGAHYCAPLLAVGVKSKKVQLVDPIPSLYLPLPKSYPIPENIQEILVRAIQGTPELEAGYSRYSIEKRQLTGWLISTYKSAISSSYSKYQYEVNFVEQLLARTGLFRSVEECRSHQDYWKDSYYKASNSGYQEGADFSYKIYKSILDVLIQDEKANKALAAIEPLKSELATIEQWSQEPTRKTQQGNK